MSVLNSSKAQWSLTRVGKANEWDKLVTIEGQFALPDGVTWNISTNYATFPNLNRDDPFSQWIGGETDTFTFDALLFSDPAWMGQNTSSKDIWTKFKQFKTLIRKDAALGRPPVCLFLYGDTIQENVVVESMGNVNIGRLTEGKFLGFEAGEVLGQPVNVKTAQVRAITLTFTLRRFEELVVRETDPTKIFRRSSTLSGKKESRYHVARTGESYESLAASEYGDPIWGDRLRKRTTDKPVLTEGDVVKIPSSDIITNEVIRPDFPAFRRRELELGKLRSIEINRSKSINSFIFP